MCGIDPDEYTGFAFGVGLERIALLKYEIDDMRLLYENDSQIPETVLATTDEHLLDRIRGISAFCKAVKDAD